MFRDYQRHVSLPWSLKSTRTNGAPLTWEINRLSPREKEVVTSQGLHDILPGFCTSLNPLPLQACKLVLALHAYGL